MIIGGTDFPIQPWPEIKTTPGFGKWKSLGTGYPSARDFGAARDIYESRILIRDIPEVLNDLQTVLAANRNTIPLSGFNDAEIIFGADVDYSAPISATVTDFGILKNVKNDVFFELEIWLRVISKTLLSTTPSLAGLRLQEKFEGNLSTEVTKLFSYDQSAIYLDNKTDNGTFTGRFLQTTEQMKAIRAYLLQVARTNAITFPSLFETPFYPFGPNTADSRFQKCKVISWKDQPLKLNLWELEITFAQVTPYFSAGADTDNYSNVALMTPSSSPAFYATPGG